MVRSRSAHGVSAACRAITLCLVVCASSTHAAGQGNWVTVYDNADASPVVRLDAIPGRTPAIDGILAMVAFQQTPFGCAGPWETMACPLTRDLGLGLQCSDAHVALVRRWFPDAMPKLSGYGEHQYSGYEGQGPDASMCERTPESATFQSHLSSLRLRRHGNEVVTQMTVSWYAQERSGSIEYRTVYRVDQDRIVVLSNREVRRSRNDEDGRNAE